jgi:hypothetical protein
MGRNTINGLQDREPYVNRQHGDEWKCFVRVKIYVKCLACVSPLKSTGASVGDEESERGCYISRITVRAVQIVL